MSSTLTGLCGPTSHLEHPKQLSQSATATVAWESPRQAVAPGELSLKIPRGRSGRQGRAGRGGADQTEEASDKRGGEV